MRRNPALTFSGALKILDRYESKTVRRLDKALGGIILAAGAGAGIAAVGGAALAPAALAAAVWGWVDQKNEAMSLLRGLTGKLSPLLRQKKGLERRQLIAAAHSVIVISAFLDVFEEYAGDTKVKDLSRADRWLTTADGRVLTEENFFEYLYSADIPTPSAAVGFAENRRLVADWALSLFLTFQAAMNGDPLHDTDRMQSSLSQLVERYESNYLRLAESAPEFVIWMMHGEHAATRTRIAGLDDAVRQAFEVQDEALARVEQVLELVARGPGERPAVGRHHEGLRRANLGVLGQPIVPSGAERYDTAVTFPTIEEAFRTPRYQIATSGRDVLAASEKWWTERPVAADFDSMIASYLTSPDATRSPLLLLGHPGAGKSLLTKVLAARLPAVDYTVVRVPLRNVGAGAPIVDQIGQALDKATNGHVQWHALVDEPSDGVLVVLLDGLDELLQATAVDRRSYLQEVMEFQRIEGEQIGPVAVVVTSRTVVADRVDIPDGTTIVKLAEFDDDQIAAWLDTWRASNRTAIKAGTVRELTFAETCHQLELARQPLLLLMLTLYSADPDSAKLDAGLSTAALYERIFDNFARREVQKRARTPLHGKELEDAVADQLRRLSVAALAIFNRGVQHLREAALRADLVALYREDVAEHEGRRLLGEFFFVHAAEGVTGETERSYEFLHATFGEYLVAQHVLDELVEVAAAAYSGRRDRDIDDKILFALLSHQVWAARRNTVDFADEIFAALPEQDRQRVRRVIVELIGDYRRRQRSSALDGYRPTPIDLVRQPAAYSANLVTLGVALTPGDTGLGLVGPFGDTVEQARAGWRSTVALWQAGLDEDGWQATLFLFDLRDDHVVLGPGFVSQPPAQYWFAHLRGDVEGARHARLGAAVAGQSWFTGGDWTDEKLGEIYSAILMRYVPSPSLQITPDGTSHQDVAAVADALALLLRLRAAELSTDFVDQAVHWLTVVPRSAIAVSVVLIVIYHHPRVLLRTPRWQEPDLYDGFERELHIVLDHAVFRLGHGDLPEWRRVRARLLGPDVAEPSDASTKVVGLLELLTQPPDLIPRR